MGVTKPMRFAARRERQQKALNRRAAKLNGGQQARRHGEVALQPPGV